MTGDDGIADTRGFHVGSQRRRHVGHRDVASRLPRPIAEARHVDSEHAVAE
jgi:hypothetical protein